MAGRKQFDVDEARRAAMLLFWEKGYAATSIDDIAAATGLGRGSLYGTFQSKSELFSQVLDLYVATYGSRYDVALRDAGQAPIDAVQAFFDTTLRRLANTRVPKGCLLVQTVASSGALEPDLRDRSRRLLGLQHHRMQGALLARLPKTATGRRRADRTARYAATVNQGLVIMHRSGASIAELRDAAASAVTGIGALLAA